MENTIIDPNTGAPVERAPKFFDYGDFYLKCHNCGHEKKLFSAVQGGVQYTIYTREDGEMHIECEKCGVHVSYLFKEAEAPAVIEDYDSATDEVEEAEVTEEVQETIEG